jgi:anti-anti-sigma factor
VDAAPTAPEVQRVVFSGDLDISRYPQLRTLFAPVETGTCPVLIVLDETVGFLDTVALSELLLFTRRLQMQDRPVALHVASRQVYRTLAIAGVAERLHAALTEEEALQVLQSGRMRNSRSAGV